jgi:CHAD domain-containing protein
MRCATDLYEQSAKSSTEVGRRTARVARYAAMELRRRRAKFVRIGTRLRSLSEADRHQLRLRGKKLRYAIEFFEDVYPGKKHRRRHHTAVRALKQFQNALGELHDLAQQRALARSYLQTSGAEHDGIAIGSTTRVSRVRCDRLLDKAVRAYREFATLKPFWL